MAQLVMPMAITKHAIPERDSDIASASPMKRSDAPTSTAWFASRVENHSSRARHRCPACGKSRATSAAK